MKKIILLGLFCQSVFAIAQTPITLTRLDFPKPTTSSILPDSVLYTNVNGLTIAQNTNGTNKVWNEWALTGTTAYQNFVPMTATPLVFQLAFLTCDYAQPLSNAGSFGSGTTGGTLSDAYEYYDYANSKLQIKGFGANITISGVAAPLPAIYSSPDVIYTFPIAFGNKDSSTSSFNISLPLTLPAPLNNVTVTVKRTQTRRNEVDAWGAVTTPAGTFDVLRIVSKIDRVDSFKTSFFDIGTPSNPVEYKWLGQTKKVPVLQINGNEVAGIFTPTTTTFWGESQIPAGTNDVQTNVNSIIIYPNPVVENASISFSLKTASKVDVEILSLKGEVVAQFHFNKPAGTFNEVLPIQAMAKGNYFINCKSGTEVLTSKFIKF